MVIGGEGSLRRAVSITAGVVAVLGVVGSVLGVWVRSTLLDTDRFHPGTYLLIFHVGAYFSAMGVGGDKPFLDVVPVRFTISEPSHYHVPLLVSPYAYSTYRGS